MGFMLTSFLYRIYYKNKKELTIALFLFYLIVLLRLSSAFFIGLYTNTCKDSPIIAVIFKIMLIIGNVNSKNVGKCPFILIVEELTPIIKMEISKGKFFINVNPPIHFHFYITIKRKKCIYGRFSDKLLYVN